MLSGTLEIDIGPMFSGKTSSLMTSINACILIGKPYYLIKHARDDRYDTNFVTTHNGVKQKANKVCNSLDFDVKEDAIFIDEGQFFNDLKPFVVNNLKAGKYIKISMLNGDFNQMMFKSVVDVLPYADKINKLSTVIFVNFLCFIYTNIFDAVKNA